MSKSNRIVNSLLKEDTIEKLVRQGFTRTKAEMLTKKENNMDKFKDVMEKNKKLKKIIMEFLKIV